MSRKSFSGAAVPTTLTSAITSSATSIGVAATTHWPDTTVGPFVVCIDRGQGSLEEKVLIASYTSTTLTVAANGRGYDGTTAQSHTISAAVVCTLDAATVTKHETFVAAVGTVTPAASAVGDTATDGASGKPADGSHRHERESFAVGATTTSATADAASDGASTSPARADHRHGREGWGTGLTTTSAAGDVRATGTSLHPARADHKHGRESFGTGASTVSLPGDAAANGSSSHLARADHRHGRETVATRAASATATAGEESICTASVTITLPATCEQGTQNKVVAATGTVTIDAPSGTTISWGSTGNASVQIATGMAISLVYSGTTWHVIGTNGVVPSGFMYNTATSEVASLATSQIGSMASGTLRGGVTYATNALFVPVAGTYLVVGQVNGNLGTNNKVNGSNIGVLVKIGTSVCPPGEQPNAVDNAYPGARWVGVVHLNAGTSLTLWCHNEAAGNLFVDPTHGLVQPSRLSVVLVGH